MTPPPGARSGARHAPSVAQPATPVAALVAAVAAGLLVVAAAVDSGWPDGSRAHGGDRPAVSVADVRGPDPLPLPEDLVDERTVVIRGSGWGHSVGMSQYGAQAQALEGRTYRDILAHYYHGTEVSRDPAAEQTIRVHLLRNRPEIEASTLVLATSSIDGQPPGSNVVVDLQAGAAIEVPFPQRWELGYDAGAEAFVLRDGEGGERARGPGPATVHFELPGGTLLRLPQLAPGPRTRVDGTFRHGVLEVTASGGQLHPVMALPVEAYLGGLAEVPSGWHEEALKAQAVAGRGYAVRQIREGLDPACRCHLDATPFTQVFTGWAKEGAWRGEAWRRAVSETAGEVVTFEGELAWTYYSSSHGGASENSEESWAYGVALPYLRSVDDPWSTHPGVDNPYAEWERRIPSEEFAAAVGLADVRSVEVTDRTAGGTPRELLVEGVGAGGETARVRYRGGEAGSAGSGLKLHFRQRLPSQQLAEITVVDPVTP